MRYFFILIATGVLMAGCASAPDGAGMLYNYGVEDNKNNDPETGPDYKDQALMFDEALRSKPNNYEALVKRGDVAMQYREFNDAVSYYSKAIVAQANNPIAYNKRGEAYFRLAKYQPAVMDFQRVITLNPRDVTAPLNLCYLFVAGKQFENAARYCERVLAIEPGNAYAQKLQAIIAKNLGQQ